MKYKLPYFIRLFHLRAIVYLAELLLPMSPQSFSLRRPPAELSPVGAKIKFKQLIKSLPGKLGSRAERGRNESVKRNAEGENRGGRGSIGRRSAWTRGRDRTGEKVSRKTDP